MKTKSVGYFPLSETSKSTVKSLQTDPPTGASVPKDHLIPFNSSRLYRAFEIHTIVARDFHGKKSLIELCYVV